MTIYADFDAPGKWTRDAISRCDQVVGDLVEILGNLGCITVLDIDGVGRITFTAGHADLEKSRAVDGKEIFQIASQTKTITAMIALLLEREKLFDLDDPVEKYLDLPIDRRITIRHLLSNSSGLGEFAIPMFFPRLNPGIFYAPRDLVALALPQGQIFEPGERFDYCNTGFVIAAMIIEKVCGLSYAAVADARIVTPLGLRQSAFGGNVPLGEKLRSYMTLPGRSEPLDATSYRSSVIGCGDGWCSANDVLTIEKSLLNTDSPLGISLDDLARETRKPVDKPYSVASLGAEYGLGIQRRAWAGAEVWGHTGSTGPCRSGTWVDVPRGVAVAAVLTQNLAFDGQTEDVRYPRGQLFAVAFETAYSIARDLRSS